MLAIAIGILLLLCRRRHRSKAPPEISGEESKAVERRAGFSRRASRKGDMLPTWKSELSGETHRAELDANNKRKRTELDGARSLTELNAAAMDSVEGSQNVSDEHAPHIESETQHGAVEVDATRPPPIPYASKPRPG